MTGGKAAGGSTVRKVLCWFWPASLRMSWLSS